jgi:hypothetical protein
VVDAAESARSVFVIRNDKSTLAVQLLNIEESLNSVLNKLPRDYILSLEGIERLGTVLSHMQEDIDSSLDNMTTLTKKTPGKSSNNAEIEKLRRRSEALHDYQSSVTSAIEEVRRGKYAVLHHAGQEQIVTIEALDLTERIEQLSTDTHALNAVVLKELEERKEKEEKQYRGLTWVSYGLYTLGWSLGLLGKMYGAELPGAE